MSFANVFLQNFTNAYQDNNLTVGTTASAAKLINTNINETDCFVVNAGAVNIQLAFGNSSVVAVNSASAIGTTQYLVPPGASFLVGTNGNQYWSAITDSGTGQLYLHFGRGN